VAQEEQICVARGLHSDDWSVYYFVRHCDRYSPQRSTSAISEQSKSLLIEQALADISW
jgi:hypothetical protein